MNRKYNHFSGSTHSFGFFSSNSDTYLTPWTENCWLCGVLSRNRRDTGSANAARARGQKRSWREKKSGGAEPQIPGGGGVSVPSIPQPGEGSAHPPRDAGSSSPCGAQEPPLLPQTHTGAGGRKTTAAARDGGQRETGQEKG